MPISKTSGGARTGSRASSRATGMKVAQLRKELGTYRREFQALRVKVPDLPDTDVSMTRLPKEQGDYLLEAAALQTCPNDKYGRKLVEQFRAMRAKRPNDVRL